MGNVLNEEKKQQVLALGRLGRGGICEFKHLGQITCQTVFPFSPPGNWLDVGLLRALPVPQHSGDGLPLLSAFAPAVVAAGVILVLAGVSKVCVCSRLEFAGLADDRLPPSPLAHLALGCPGLYGLMRLLETAPQKISKISDVLFRASLPLLRPIVSGSNSRDILYTGLLLVSLQLFQGGAVLARQ